NGDMIYSTNAPSLIKINPQGKRLAEALPPNGDFRFAGFEQFRLSDDATRLTLPMQADGSQRRFFALGDEPSKAYRIAQADDVLNTLAP
ncbi:hypothetical protein ABTM82_19295, partial [Acinetobacter baumannii]